MRAGLLDRRITLQQPTETQSDSGEIISTWSDVATVHAQLVNLPGSERFAYQQTIGRAFMTLRMRYSSITKQITVKWRVVMDGRALDIADVRETRTREEIQIDAFAPSEVPV